MEINPVRYSMSSCRFSNNQRCQVDSAAKILVIDDDGAIRKYLRAVLHSPDYLVVEAENGEDGVRAAAKEQPDVVLLDLGLPDVDGVEVAKRLREWSRVPIIVLSARGQETDKVAALDAGADDYLTKPFGSAELLARIRVALRHSAPVESAPVIEAHGVRIDLATREVSIDGKDVHLTPNEFALLSILARNAGKVVTHQQLLTNVWGPEYKTESHYLRVYMGQLRHKLEMDPSQPKLISTESGVGYRLRAE